MHRGDGWHDVVFRATVDEKRRDASTSNHFVGQLVSNHLPGISGTDGGSTTQGSTSQADVETDRDTRLQDISQAGLAGLNVFEGRTQSTAEMKAEILELRAQIEVRAGASLAPNWCM